MNLDRTAYKGYPKKVYGDFKVLLYCYDKTQDTLYDISLSNGLVKIPSWDGSLAEIETTYRYMRIFDIIQSKVVEYKRLKENYSDEHILNSFKNDPDLVVTEDYKDIGYYRMVMELSK